MNLMKLPSVAVMERWPWAIRGLLGCLAAVLPAVLTYSIGPLRSFPLLLGFPTVILTAWFLGVWGGALCAFTEAVLVDLFLTRTQVRFSTGDIREELRLGVFLVISTFVGWAIRRLAQQKAQFSTREWQQRLTLAHAERQLAEERAHASEELRERDDLLQLALCVNSMGRWVWDLQEDRLHWSDEVYRMVGSEPGAIDLSSDAWFRLIHPEDLGRVKEAVAHARDAGADYHQQYRVVLPDGSVRWLESQGKCQWNSDGQVTRVLGVLADVTHRKQTEEAMLRAEKLAVAGRLAASVAHEINNPMEAVSNLLYLITLAESAEVARTHARHALDELMRISQITQQTLKFHRQDGRPKCTRLSEIVETVLTLFRGKLRSAQIDAHVCAERETLVACMPTEIQQIFANLVSNAIDAMPGSGRLVVRLRPSRDWRDGATAGMRITFSDSGVGMDRATMRRIFEPFFTTKTETGTGLGMWVVAQLVERHHGQIRVWSTQRAGGSGTAVSLFLPSGSAAATDNLAANSLAGANG
jgi:PAS domain S-box-containing protein